jgi:hypothetical protein
MLTETPPAPFVAYMASYSGHTIKAGRVTVVKVTAKQAQLKGREPSDDMAHRDSAYAEQSSASGYRRVVSLEELYDTPEAARAQYVALIQSEIDLLEKRIDDKRALLSTLTKGNPDA